MKSCVKNIRIKNNPLGGLAARKGREISVVVNIKRSYKLVSKILSAKLRHNWGGMKSEDLSLIKHLVDALYEDWELSQRAYLDITKGFSESDIAELEKDSDRSESK